MTSNPSNEGALSLKSNIVWNTVGNFFYLFCQWLLTYVVVKILGFTGAGVFSLAMTISTSFYSIASYYMRNYQVSDIDAEFSDRVYVASRIVTCLVAFVLCLVFEFANGYSLYTFLCVAMYMAFKVSEAYSDVYQGILQKKMRLDYVGKSFLLKGVLTLLAFTLGLLITKSLLVAITALAAVSFAVVFLYDRRKAIVDRKAFRKEQLTLAALKGLLLVCLPLAIHGFLLNITCQAPRYFIELLAGEQALGYYTSVALPVVVVQVSASFVFSPLVTPMSHYLSDKNVEAFRALVIKVMVFLAALSMVSLLLGAWLGEPVLVLAFGEAIREYAYLLLPLIGCAILTALSWFLASVLTVVRRLKQLIAISVVTTAIMLVGCVPAIEAWGMNGASLLVVFDLLVFSVCCSVVAYLDLKRRNASM